MPVDQVRDAAIDVLLRVFEKGAYLSIALDKTIRRKNLSERGRRFLTQLVYGTVRHRLLCDHILSPVLHQSSDKLPVGILAVLRMGVFQALFCNQVTFPAMVHTSVDLAKKRGHAGTAKLVNAVLKRCPQSLEDVKFPDPKTDRDRYLSTRYSIPTWLLQLWTDEYGPDIAENLCAVSNETAPNTIRVNTLKSDTVKLMADLERAGCPAEKRTVVPEELTLLAGIPPARTKLFMGGHFLIQDAASMIPPHLLEPKPGHRVLDLCASPGGKTTHLAQLTGGKAQIVAMDLHASKLALVRQNADRLELPGIMTVCADGRRPPFQENFDRVLVDAPCSGLGTLRRHPELKWRLRPEEPAQLAELQCRLLRCAVQLCKNGGLIVYSVCTMARRETDEVIQAVLADGHLEPEDGPPWLAQWRESWGQYRILPQSDGLDGFFLTRFRKVS